MTYAEAGATSVRQMPHLEPAQDALRRSSPGLRGGRWTYTGDRTTVFHLHGVRLTRDLAVSGTGTWKRYANTMRVSFTVAGHGHTGKLTGHWATRRTGARAHVSGTFAGHPVRVTFRAP